MLLVTKIFNLLKQYHICPKKKLYVLYYFLPILLQRTVGRTVGRTDGRTDGRSDGRSVGRTDGRSDGRTDINWVWKAPQNFLTPYPYLIRAELSSQGHPRPPNPGILQVGSEMFEGGGFLKMKWEHVSGATAAVSL